MIPDPPTSQIVADCPSCGARSDVTAHEPFTRVTCPSCEEPFRARDRFNHFTLEEQTGTGGMSRVFRARDTSLQRDVALKILNRACSQDSNRVRQFEKEAEITAQVSHPNVVRVFTAGRDQGYFYIAMELVSGGSLEALLRERRKLPEIKVLEIAVQAVQGLRAAHKAGLIHRDIKPGNILFAEDGTPKIVDFGLAIFAREADGSGEIWATPYYVPPETLHHEPEDFRSDIYSLGATLYHALVGRPACDKDQAPLAELKEIKAKPIHVKPSATKLSEETCAVLERALAVKRESRYRSYDEFLEHLKYAQRRLRRDGKGKPWPGRRRNEAAPWRWIAGAAALVTVGFFAVKTLRKPAVTKPAAGGSLITDADPTARSDSNTSIRYNNARDAMLAGDFSKARGLFEELGNNAGTRQPTRNWARFNAGLCALFIGDGPGAKKTYAEMAGEDFFSASREDADLAGFFKSAAGWLAADGLIVGDKTAECPPHSVRAIGLLAAGLKNWNAGDAAAALPFFRGFLSSTPPGWVENCKALIGGYLADAETAVTIPSKAPDQLSLEEAEASVTTGQALLAKLKLPGAVKEKATASMKTLSDAVARRKQELMAAHGSHTQRANGELKAIQDASAGAAALGREYRFSEAATKISSLPASSPEVLAVRKAHVESWQNAHRFLEQLVKDLASRSAEGVIEISGQPVRTTITASGTVLSAKPPQVPAHSIPIGKADPVLLMQLATDIRARSTDSDDYYRRSELIYCFALRTGLKNTAADTAESLAEESINFRNTLSMLNTVEVVTTTP
jgi:hypothetical protein